MIPRRPPQRDTMTGRTIVATTVNVSRVGRFHRCAYLVVVTVVFRSVVATLECPSSICTARRFLEPR